MYLMIKKVPVSLVPNPNKIFAIPMCTVLEIFKVYH